MRLAAAVTVLTLSAAPAYALVGEPEQTFAEGERQHRFARDVVQNRLDQTVAWQDFLTRRGDWTAMWDEATRTPARFWGEGWAVGDLSTDAAAFAEAWTIVAQESELLGLTLAELTEGVVDRQAGITTVSFFQRFGDLAVEHSRISLRFKAGRFVMGQFESMPGIGATIDARAAALDADKARANALAELGWAWEYVTEKSAPELVVYPVLREQSVDYRLAWRTDLRANDRVSWQHSWIDAVTGELIASREQIRFAEATVAVEHDDRYPQQGLTTSPFARVWTRVDDSMDVAADHDGVIEFEGDSAEVVYAAGSPHFRVRTHTGDLHEFTGTVEAGGTLVGTLTEGMDATDHRRALAQMDTHVAAHAARARALSINPNFPWAAQRATAWVNDDQMQCNAFFDGSINFMVQGGGCNNTGRVADVVAHEYGHGFHAYSIIQGVGAFDGALSEGVSDYLAATMSGDPATARGFFTQGTGPLRDIAQNRVWPDDVSEIHQTGIIIAGALWDTRTALIDALGTEAGITRADFFLGQVNARATDIPTAYPEVMLADDDNGNLADGTPNGCLIDDAFGLHGLGPAATASGLFTLSHELFDGRLEGGVDLDIGLAAELTRPECTDGSIESAVVRWSHDGDDWTELPMDGAAGAFAAVVPGAADGTIIRYVIDVFDAAGNAAGTLPNGSFSDPWYEVFVGSPVVVFEATFEEDDGGFRSELIVGDANTEGANDWQWGTPGGQAGDPTAAWSGDNIWGNDLSPLENWNGAYQPNIHNVLSSPIVTLPDDFGRTYVQFRRWLNVEDGYWDSAWIEVNGATIWNQHASTDENEASKHHQDTHWALRTYDVTDLVAGDGTVSISWHLRTDGGLQLGGWNLDDVRVLTFPGDGLGPDGEVPGLGGDGCEAGCSASGSRGFGLLGLLGLVGLVVRRRR